MTLYYADLRIHNERGSTLGLAIEAASFSVAVAQAEAWAAGYNTRARVAEPEAKVVNVTSGRKPKGRNYHRLSDSAAIYEELTQ